jgi:hypothetical protein
MKLNLMNIVIVLVVIGVVYYLYNQYANKGESKYSEGQLDGGDILNLQTGKRTFTVGDV